MDKIALIKAEIKRLYNDKSYSEDRWDMGYDCACEDMMSFLSTLESEEPDKSLEEEIKDYFQGYWPGTDTAEQCNTDLHFTPPAIMRLARHFAKWQKEQMMEEAVEGFVAAHLTSEGTKITVNSGYLPKEMCIKPGEEVRIIVCKKED